MTNKKSKNNENIDNSKETSKISVVCDKLIYRNTHSNRWKYCFLYIEIFTFFNKRGLFKNIFDKKEG